MTLFAAVDRDDLQLIRETVADHGDLDPRDRAHRTPLMYAIIDHKAAAARLLVGGGADVNASEEQGWTPLHFAAQEADPSLIELLLLAGANVHARNIHGNTALGVALVSPAVEGDSLATIRSLLRAGADPDVKNEYGMSPRDTAALMQEPFRSAFGKKSHP